VGARADTGSVPRTTILTTPRLALTTWEPADVDDLLLVHSDPETMRFVRHGRPETRCETAELIDAYRAEQAARGWTKWRLADRWGQLVGRAGFGGSDGDREMGYTIRRDLWGEGRATEIASALVRWHRRQAPVHRLGAYVAVENTASVRVLEKVGFVREGPAEHHGLACHRYRLATPNDA
jgi:[ribosomal protein S5]-alanine N-acetyltransferase